MNISFIHDLNVQYLLNCTMSSLQFTITVTILILFWGCCCRCYRVLDVFFPILDWFIIEHILTRGNNQKPPQLFTVVNEYKYRWKITQTLTNHLCTMYYVLDNFKKLSPPPPPWHRGERGRHRKQRFFDSFLIQTSKHGNMVTWWLLIVSKTVFDSQVHT